MSTPLFVYPLVCKRKNNRNHLASDRSCFARKKSRMSCTRHCDASSTNEKRNDLLIEFISDRFSLPTRRRENSFSSFLTYSSDCKWLKCENKKSIIAFLDEEVREIERETSLWSSLIIFRSVTSQWMDLDTCSLLRSLWRNERYESMHPLLDESFRVTGHCVMVISVQGGRNNVNNV